MRERLSRSSDGGFTLVELIVAMGIFSIVVAVFTGALVSMSRGTARAAATAKAGDELRLAFQRLDKQVRYADGVNFPGTGTAGRRYVEFRVPAVAARTGVDTCVQWQWDPTARTIASRSWVASAATLPGFTIYVRNVIVDPQNPTDPDYPFILEPANAQHPRQALSVSVFSSVNANSRIQSSSTTFVARNSTTDSDGNLDSDANGVSDRPVCSPGGVRP